MQGHVAIVGGGFSGTLQAINLLRHDGPRATLIERRQTPGVGLAYGEAAPDHVLNVRAANMSALPDQPDHFVRWLERRGVADAAWAFVPRLTYGAYLQELLADAIERQPGRLEILCGDALDCAIGAAVTLTLADGRAVTADTAILAVGNLPPHHPRGLSAAMAGDLYAADPWEDDATAELTASDTVLILGTGLTMVDMVLKLDAEGFRGQMLALSRRGLLPHRHGEPVPFTPIDDRPAPRASSLVHSVRARAGEVGWRNAVDELRRFTTPLWRAADDAARERFLRHLRPWWDIHRHRIAPAVADRLGALIAEGRLTVAAGKTISFEPVQGAMRATFRRRGEEAPETRSVRRVINCTGPQGDLFSARDPLLQSLTKRGLIRPDPLRIGIDVDAQARTLAADGSANEQLYAIGPMTRGASWEIVAVPDIRVQVWTVARRMSNAHWIGGEGL